MSTPGADVLSRMYPTMTPAAPTVVATTAAPIVRENKGMKLQAGDNTPNVVELQPNRGMGLQAGIDEPLNDEQAAHPANPIKETPEAVTAPDAPAALSEESLAALLPPDLKAEREARGNDNRYGHLLRADASNSQHAMINKEIGAMFSDHNATPEDATSVVYLARKFIDGVPEATLTNWRSAVTTEERTAAEVAMNRYPFMREMLKAYNIAEAPQVIRLLAKGRR